MGRALRTLAVKGGGAVSAVFRDGGRLLEVATFRTIETRAMPGARLVRRLRVPNPVPAAFSPDGETLATTTEATTAAERSEVRLYSLDGAASAHDANPGGGRVVHCVLAGRYDTGFRRGSFRARRGNGL